MFLSTSEQQLSHWATMLASFSHNPRSYMEFNSGVFQLIELV